MPACLDTLLIGLYVLAEDFFEPRRGPGRPPSITDAELVCLAVAQVLLDCPGDRRFLAMARYRLGHLFPYLPKQLGYNKRLRALAPRIVRLIDLIAFESPSLCDGLWLLDGTPVPCGESRQTGPRSELAGYVAYGWSSSRSRFFWGFRLLLLCAPDGMPIGFELVPANVSERRAAAEILERIPLAGHTFVADKGFAGHEFEALVDALGGRLLRPDRKNEPRHRGALGGVRQLDRVDHRHLQGPAGASRGTDAARLMARIAQRLLGLAATVRHNQLAGRWDRSLVAYDH